MTRIVGLALLLCLPRPAAASEWYEAYQDGTRALRQGRHQQALLLLEEAIRLRPQPGLNIRTYGTNIEPAYFPYLRLAEAHLGLGSLEGARLALARSDSLGVEPAAERARLRARLDALALPASPKAQPASPALGPAPPATQPSPEPQASAESAPAPTTRPPAADAGPAPQVASAFPGHAPTPAPVAYPSPARAPAEGVRSPPVGATPMPAPASPAASAAVPATTPESQPLARLELISEPPSAGVYLDDEPVGVTSPTDGRLVLRDVAPGRRRLRFAKDGYADVLIEADLAPGASLTLRGPLAPRPAAREPLALVGGTALALALAALLWRAGRARPRGAADEHETLSRVSPDPRRWSSPRTPGGSGATPTPEGLPQRFGDYLLLERLGRGGMATVFKAERDGELRALKRPRGEVSDDPQYLERFLREAEIGRTLHHPNVIRVYDRGEVDGRPYFTMELIEGETLSARLKRDGALPLREAARVVMQIAEALDYAHSKGVVHRDLKPSNIMTDGTGELRVMDFGIARARRFEGLTVTGAFLGSPDYAAPEAIDGRNVEARSDLYSLGVIFYELLCGRRPFEAESPFLVLQQACSQPPPPPAGLRPDLPPELQAIVLRLLAKHPADRFSNAEELILALRAWLDRQPEAAAG